MRLDCQLRAFNAEVTASPRIALSTMLLWLAHWARNFLWDARRDCLWLRGVFPLPRFWFAKDKVVLSSISWQSGFPLFVLGYFFLLGMGLGLDMKWARVPRSFGPTIAPQNPAVRLLGRKGGFWCSRAYIMARSRCFGIWGALSLILLWDDEDHFSIRNVYSMAPLWNGTDLAVEDSLGNWAKFISLDIPFLSFVRGELSQISSSI